MASKETSNLESSDKGLKRKSSSKRKRDSEAAEEEDEEAELEIDINAPEPASKKAKRKEKKSLRDSHSKKERPVLDGAAGTGEDDKTKDVSASTTALAEQKKNEHSDYGVWIGNLPFTVSKDDIRRFLSEQGAIAETLITRLHMPAPSDGKSKNKGFAYVDFTTVQALNQAIALSEKLLGGRRTLIKNAKSFEGRPEKPKGKEDAAPPKEASKRVFVGNLSYDVTRDDLAEHFGRAGAVEDVFLATFEDSGKCKGFGWVRFEEVGAAEAAVKGFVKVDDADDEHDGTDGEAEVITEKGGRKGKSKTRKVFINRINGRPLRCEFAEDAQTRYKKRYGKESKGPADAKRPRSASDRDAAPGAQPDGEVNGHAALEAGKGKNAPKGTADDRRAERRKKHDARRIAPGQSLASAPRASAAIVAGKGKKISFD